MPGTLTVSPASLTVSGSKVYNNSTAFAVGNLNVTGAVAGETVTLTAGTGTTSSVNVNSYAGSALSGLAINVTGGGASASNYTLPSTGSLTITAAPLTVTGVTNATGTTYGTLATLGTATFSGLIGSDALPGAVTGTVALADSSYHQVTLATTTPLPRQRFSAKRSLPA